MDFNALNLDIRDISACARTGCKTVEELKQRIADDPEGIRRQLGFATYDRVEDAILELSENQQPVIVSSAYTSAVEADAMVNAGMELMGSGLYQMCMGVKKMHDGKLYKEFGFQNFEDYCKSKGFSKRHGERLVQIAKMEEQENATPGSHFERLGFKKNYLLSLLEPEDRQELIETHNVEDMTVKELEAAKAEIERLKAERDENEHAAELLSDELDSAKESILEKESRIRELENQPVQHDITDVDSAAEIERLKKELEDERLRVMTAEKSAESKARRAADEARHELTQMHETELQTIKDGYEKQLAEAQKPDADHASLNRERFEALRVMFEHAVDELENFLEDVQSRKERIGYIKNLDKYFRDAILDQIDD